MKPILLSFLFLFALVACSPSITDYSSINIVKNSAVDWKNGKDLQPIFYSIYRHETQWYCLETSSYRGKVPPYARKFGPLAEEDVQRIFKAITELLDAPEKEIPASIVKPYGYEYTIWGISKCNKRELLYGDYGVYDVEREMRFFKLVRRLMQKYGRVLPLASEAK